MCRMAAWCGAPRPLSALLYDAPHALERQAYAPRAMLSGTVSVDGTGVVWWPHGPATGDAAALRFATERPPWSDANLRRLAPRLLARVAVALVRSATPGQALGEAAVGPFEFDGLAVAHNGFVEPWHGRVRRVLLEALDDDLHARAEPGTDSQVLALSIAQARRRAPDAPLGELVESAVLDVARRVEHLDARARLDVLVADGTNVAALRCAVGLESNSLFVCTRADGTAFASEPLDDGPEWRALEPGRVWVVSAAPDGTHPA